MTSIIWKEVATDDGRTYFYNTSTMESAWSTPCDWQEILDPKGTPYYFNSTTNETTWDVPPEFYQGLPKSSKPKSKRKKKLKKRDSIVEATKEPTEVSYEATGSNPSTPSKSQHTPQYQQQMHTVPSMSQQPQQMHNVSAMTHNQNRPTSATLSDVSYGYDRSMYKEAHPFDPQYNYPPQYQPSSDPHSLRSRQVLPPHPMSNFQPGFPQQMPMPPFPQRMPYPDNYADFQPNPSPFMPPSQQAPVPSASNSPEVISALKSLSSQVSELKSVLTPMTDLVLSHGDADESSSPLVLASKLHKWGSEIERMKNEVKEKKADAAFLRERLESAERRMADVSQQKEEFNRDLLLAQEENRRSQILHDDATRRLSQELEILQESFSQSRTTVGELRESLLSVKTQRDKNEQEVSELRRSLEESRENLAQSRDNHSAIKKLLDESEERRSYFESRTKTLESELHSIKTESDQTIRELSSRVSSLEMTQNMSTEKASMAIHSLQSEMNKFKDKSFLVVNKTAKHFHDKLISKFKKSIADCEDDFFTLDEVVTIASSVLRSAQKYGQITLDGDHVISSDESEEEDPIVVPPPPASKPTPLASSQTTYEQPPTSVSYSEEVEQVEEHDDDEGEDFQIVEIPAPSSPLLHDEPEVLPVAVDNDMTVPFVANPTDLIDVVEDEEYHEEEHADGFSDSDSELHQEESVIPSQAPLLNQEASVPDQMDDMYGSHDDSDSEHWSEDEVPPPPLAGLPPVSFDPEEIQKENLRAALFEDDDDEDFDF
ncbi:hypothetical protein GEMRC1_004872 [Eukaryota sp. GEM-RC1]